MRGRPNPYPALAVVTLVPALALGAIWKVADDRQPPAVDVSPATGPGAVPAVLTTPLLSVRRAPSLLALEASTVGFDTAMEPLYAALGETACVAVSVDGETIAAANESAPLLPAGVQAIVIGAVALDVLGDDFRYTTVVQGDVDRTGLVAGNLYLVGGGDPVLTNWWSSGSDKAFPPTNRTTFDELVDLLITAGVTRVKGSVVGDATRYGDEEYPPSWGAEAKLQAGPISALLVNDGTDTKTGRPRTAAAAAAEAFTSMLEAKGIRVDGEPRSGRSNSSVTLATLPSSPLAALVKEMLTTADANTAEMMLREIGLAATGIGTRDAGIAVVTQRLESWGIDVDAMSMVDGSGLSSTNRTTCDLLLAVLQHSDPDDAVGSGLAVAGADGGRLVDDFPADNPLYGTLRAAMGTQFNIFGSDAPAPAVKSLAGYVPLPDGRTVELVMILNGETIVDPIEYGPLFEMLADIIDSHLLNATAADLAPR